VNIVLAAHRGVPGPTVPWRRATRRVAVSRTAKDSAAHPYKNVTHTMRISINVPCLTLIPGSTGAPGSAGPGEGHTGIRLNPLDSSTAPMGHHKPYFA
jgi:hypothetical protein